MEPSSNPIENKIEWKIKNLKELLQQLLNNKEWDKSLVIGEILKTLIPEDPVLHWAMGISYLELHDLDRGEKCLLRAMELGDDSPDTLLLLAKISGYRWDLNGENYWAEKAIEKDPDNIHARFVLAYTNLRLGAMDKAEILFKEIIRIDPENVQARSALAEIYQSLQKLTDAEKQLREAIDLQPNNGFLYTRQGEVLGMLKRDEDALTSYFRALELDPVIPERYYNIGDTFLALGDAEQAVLFLRRASEMDPYNTLTHYDLGRALLDLKKYQLAAIESKAALREDPDIAFGKTNIGLSARQNLGVANMNLGKFEEAEACFRQNLKLIAPNFFNLGLSLFRQKKFDKALKNFQRAVELVPDDPEYWDLAGNAYSELNRLPEAREALQKAIEVDETYACAHYDLGTVLARIPGREDEALESFHRAIDLNQDEPHPYYAIACIHALRSDKELAFDFLEKALQKGFMDRTYIDTDADLKNIRNDERWQELKRKYLDKREDQDTAGN